MKFKKVVITQAYYQAEYDEEHSEEFEAILNENPKGFYTEEITEIEKHILSKEAITTTGKHMLILKKGNIVNLPVHLAVMMVANNEAKPFVPVDADYGFAPEPPKGKVSKETLTDQGDAEADIEKQVKAALRRETAATKRKAAQEAKAEERAAAALAENVPELPGDPKEEAKGAIVENPKTQ